MSSWLSSHVAEVSAVGTIAMNVATLAIIYFNMTQFKLNRRTLNIEVNFKVFELRKKIFRSMEEFIKTIKIKNDFSDFIDVDGSIRVANKNFLSFKESIEDCKYLFSKNLTEKIESFLIFCECGILTECQLQQIKNQNSGDWTSEDTRKIQELSAKKNDLIEGIVLFEVDEFLDYLNVSNFHKDFISNDPVKYKQTAFFNAFNMVKKVKRLLLPKKVLSTEIG